jgi:hypothetical protein
LRVESHDEGGFGADFGGQAGGIPPDVVVEEQKRSGKVLAGLHSRVALDPFVGAGMECGQ